MSDRNEVNEAAEAKDTDVNQLDGPERKDASDVKDLTVEAQLPRGDHVSVGGLADEVGEAEVVTQDAQVAPGIAASQGGEPVQEIYVLTDKVVTDPTGPLGVQIPSAAVTGVHLPIHDLAKGTPDQQLARGEGDAEPGMVASDQE